MHLLQRETVLEQDVPAVAGGASARPQNRVDCAAATIIPA